MQDDLHIINDAYAAERSKLAKNIDKLLVEIEQRLTGKKLLNPSFSTSAKRLVKYQKICEDILMKLKPGDEEVSDDDDTCNQTKEL